MPEEFIDVFHGSTDYIFPEEQIDLSRGEFYTTPDPDVATEYAFNEFSKDSATSGKSATDPTVLRFQVDKNKFITTNTGRDVEGDQASRRAAYAKGVMARDIAKARGVSPSDPGVQRQVWRLMNAGIGTQGQREFAGERSRIPRQDGIQYVIPPESKIEITRTGTAGDIEDHGDLEFIPQNIPQTRVAPSKTSKPVIGVSGHKGAQVTGPKLTQFAKDFEDRGSYFDLAPLDGDGDHIHASLDPDDPLYRPR